MRSSITTLIVLMLAVSAGFAQNGTITVIDNGWTHFRVPQKKAGTQSSIPAPTMVDQNRNFQRNARENQMQQRSVADPNEHTVDGRSAQLQRLMDDARAANYDGKIGYTYTANVRNDSARAIDIVFWEYRFVERAAPTNIVVRHFLCGASIKPGDRRELTAVSTRGPSDTISAESLAKADGKLFDEQVYVNRVEYSDGFILQRTDWKYDDYKKAIKGVTSTPWGNEVCRML